MRASHGLCFLGVICLMLVGCATQQKSRHLDDSLWAQNFPSKPYTETEAERHFRRSFEMAMETAEEDEGDFSIAGRENNGLAPLRANRPEIKNRLLRRAHAAIGTPYVPGGTEPGGFDCSGLVCWAYSSVGVKLPRTAREQSVVGRRVKNVAEMQAGDIVAFRHPRRGYHTGIYVGGGKFIHSPHRRARVRINSLDDPYFSNTFLGARRVNLHGRENLLAQAESRLNDYAEEKFVRELSRKKSSMNKSERGLKRDRGKMEPQKNKRMHREVADHDRRHLRGDLRGERSHRSSVRSERRDRQRETLKAQVEQKKGKSKDLSAKHKITSQPSKSQASQSDKKKKKMAANTGDKKKADTATSRKRKSKS